MASPSEAEIQNQWKAAVNILEHQRALADDTIAPTGGLMDVLQQQLEGDFTPAGLSAAMASFRAGLSNLVSPGMVVAFLDPIIYEYAKIVTADATGFGSGYTNRQALFSAIYEHFHRNSLSVQSRAIGYDTSATTGKPDGSTSNDGNGAMARLTVDENGYPLEACTVETKRFRCRQDANTGTELEAEVFEVMGSPSSYDALLRAVYGSGDRARQFIRSRHAGSGAGGSLLMNSSFTDYSASGSPKFTAWTETAGGAYVSRDGTTYYRGCPGVTTPYSLKITGGSGTVTLSQPLSAMRIRSFDQGVPYFFRVMVNKTVGSASGGSFTIRLGASSTTVAISALGTGWQEVVIAAGTGCWPRIFNQDSLSVQIEWSSSTSGDLYVDDAILAPWDLIDGTYWLLRGNAGTHAPWLVDDMLVFTDTGGAPDDAIIQWYLWVAGLGYLPSDAAAPTLADPT